MGLPGAGKTTLSKKLSKLIDAEIINADKIRKEANDWDFSNEGRVRQAKRMSAIAEQLKKKGKYVIADFVCPTDEARKLFDPDFIVWVDTIKKGRFEDTNQMFQAPIDYNVRVTEQESDIWSVKIAEKLTLYFSNKEKIKN